MRAFILDGHEPIVCQDMISWAQWFGSHDRTVAFTEMGKGLSVSTVFLGIDHQFGEGEPILFETMVFDKNGEGDEQYRYSTWEEAEAAHYELCERISGSLKIFKQF